MKLPTIKDLDFSGKRVLLRADVDVEMEVAKDDLRIKTLVSLVKTLSEESERIVIIGHKGRPGRKRDKNLSLKPLADLLGEMMDVEDAHLMENLRFNKGEEENDEYFAKHLAEEGDVFVNEAFASSHRKHASIVSLPNLLPHAAGPRFVKEVESLSKVFSNPERPVVALLGGSKEGKKDYIEGFKSFADKILVGGRLPAYMDEGHEDKKVIVGRLIQDKEDLTLNTVEEFEKEVKSAKTIVVAGPMGKFEEDGHLLGTKRVFQAIAESEASYKVAGGGETARAIKELKLESNFDWISVGGGATLEFLSKGTLPGIDALLN